MPQAKDWREMMEWSAGLLERRTGAGVPEWNARVLASGIDGEPELRTWLAEQGVTGYAQMLLVMERFGYPDFLLATADELVDGQYADRVGLRLPDQDVGGRLESAKLLGIDIMTVRIPLHRPGDVDDEVVDWLGRAYAANL